MKEHALVVMIMVLISNFLLPVCVSFSQLLVHHFLNLQAKETERRAVNVNESAGR